MFIGVSGLVGAGKSTLTRQLAAELAHRSPPLDGGPSWKAYLEPVEENPYLEDFYKDIARWTFNMQIFLLGKRFQQHQEVLWDPRHRLGGGIVQDRTIYEDTIFARMHRDDGLMSDRDWDTYITHFHVMQGFLRYPDVILYLRCSPTRAAERIRSRGRWVEKEIPLAYLENLNAGYEEFVQEMKRYTIVVELDWNEFRPTSEVVSAIREATEGHTAQKFLRSLRRI